MGASPTFSLKASAPPLPTGNQNGEALKAEIAQTTGDPAELKAEFRHLAQVFGK